MTRTTRLTTRLAAAGLVVATMTFPTSASPTSVTVAADWSTSRLIANPGFEDPGGLTPWNLGQAGGTATLVAGGHGSSAHAIRLSDTSTSAAVFARSAPIAVVPGEQLTASAWALPDGRRAGSLYVEFWNGEDPAVRVGTTLVSVPVNAVADAWTQLTTAPLIAPDDAVTATALVYSPKAAGGTPAAVTLWDDVSVASRGPSMRKIPNADFEESREFGAGTDGVDLPTQWKLVPLNATAKYATVATDHTFSGSHGLKIDDRSAAGAGAGKAVILTSRPIPITVGETVTATVWGRSPTSPAVGKLAVEGVDANENPVGTYTAHPITSSTWAPLSGSVTGTSTVRYMRIKLYTTAQDEGLAYFDTVSLRSSLDDIGTDANTYDPTVLGRGTVLSVGDQRVESHSGDVTRHVQQVRGAPIALPDYPLVNGFDDTNARLFGTVLCTDPSCANLMLWYTANAGNVGYATSSDAGATWTNHGPTTNSQLGNAQTIGTVVAQRGPIPGVPASSKYVGLRNINASDQRYEAMWSADGITWTPVYSPTAPTVPVAIKGFDVSNLTYDDVRQRYVATVKEWQSVAPRGPRTVWTSTSVNFIDWTDPTPSYAADNTDYTNPLPGRTSPESTDIYGMPAIRYGEQLLGLPWMFDIDTIVNPLGNPGPDLGPAKIGITTSLDAINWSRPARTPLIGRGATTGDWDLGFHTTSNGLVQVPGTGQVDLYYSASRGPHAAAEKFTIGRVSWDIDRFVSWHADAAETGTVTTRTLDLEAGATLALNAKTGPSGSLRVDVLDPDGTVRSGCAAGFVVGANVDAQDGNRAVAQFASTCSLTGESRLRFELTGADLFSYRVD